MFPSAPVVYFLDACRERLKTTPRQSWPDEVQRFASDFSQTFPLVEESQRELLDFYAPSEAMKLVLSKLASGKPFPAPKTLRYPLTVQAQIRALSATASWDGLTALMWAHLQLHVPELPIAVDTIIRTLYYEGLITHCPGTYDSTPLLCSDRMRQRIVSQFPDALRSLQDRKCSPVIRPASTFAHATNAS
jgi:hypothetical protein